MNPFQDQLTQLSEQLQQLQEQLAPWLDPDALKARQAQLQTTERSVERLQKQGYPVPDELRELKFRLLAEIDQAEAARTTYEDLLQVLRSHLPSEPVPPIKPAPPSRRKPKPRKPPSEATKAATAVSLTDLVQAGLLQPGAVFVRTYKKTELRTTLTETGQLRLDQEGQATLHDSPSSAAVAATQKSQNGWTFWQLQGDEKSRNLDYYRKKYLAHETQR